MTPGACTACRQANPWNARFCTRCGKEQFQGEAATSTLPPGPGSQSLPGTTPFVAASSKSGAPKTPGGCGGCLAGIALIVGLFVVGGVVNSCSGGHGSYRAQPAGAPVPAATDGPKLVTKGLMSNLFDVYVGKSYHLQEGMTDNDWATSLVLARTVGNRDGITAAYSEETYRHYGNANEGAKPLCKVDDQNPVDVVTDGGLNDGGPRTPIACHLQDGTQMYATALDP